MRPWHRAATHSTPITCDLRNSIEFNQCRNLVRDQGVGGSNPLSPTKFFGICVSFLFFPSNRLGGSDFALSRGGRIVPLLYWKDKEREYTSRLPCSRSKISEPSGATVNGQAARRKGNSRNFSSRLSAIPTRVIQLFPQRMK